MGRAQSRDDNDLERQASHIRGARSAHSAHMESVRIPSLTRLLAACVCALSVVLATLPADAKSRSKSSKSAGPKVTYINGDSEAQRQRREDDRLRRECKGRPNAGACLGYTR